MLQNRENIILVVVSLSRWSRSKSPLCRTVRVNAERKSSWNVRANAERKSSRTVPANAERKSSRTVPANAESQLCPTVRADVESQVRRVPEENQARLDVLVNAERLVLRASQARKAHREQQAHRVPEENPVHAARQVLQVIRKTVYLHPFPDRKLSCRKMPAFR